MAHKKRKLISIAAGFLIVLLCGCETQAFTYTENHGMAFDVPKFEMPICPSKEENKPAVTPTTANKPVIPTTAPTVAPNVPTKEAAAGVLNETMATLPSEKKIIALKDIPKYSGKPYVTLNNNNPLFVQSEVTTKSFESYGALDSLGRCTTTFACVGKDIMPTNQREEIGAIRPTGWHTVKYNGIDGNYLYNRCHLIAFCLTAENANPNNLITGTRYMNVEGMLPFEIKAADYLDHNPANHVLYRVTPLFDGNNLVCDGVLMEAYSVEDGGAGVQFCVFVYNIQPGITIDYATGESSGPAFTGN